MWQQNSQWLVAAEPFHHLNRCIPIKSTTIRKRFEPNTSARQSDITTMFFNIVCFLFLSNVTSLKRKVLPYCINSKSSSFVSVWLIWLLLAVFNCFFFRIPECSLSLYHSYLLTHRLSFNKKQLVALPYYKKQHTLLLLFKYYNSSYFFPVSSCVFRVPKLIDRRLVSKSFSIYIRFK